MCVYVCVCCVLVCEGGQCVCMCACVLCVGV